MSLWCWLPAWLIIVSICSMSLGCLFIRDATIIIIHSVCLNWFCIFQSVQKTDIYCVILKNTVFVLLIYINNVRDIIMKYCMLGDISWQWIVMDGHVLYGKFSRLKCIEHFKFNTKKLIKCSFFIWCYIKG